MHRRRFLQSAVVSGAASPLIVNAALASQPATPHGEATPESDRSLADRVSQIDPQTLLEGLLATPVTTPLFPSDTASVEPVVWDDESDTDLEGTIGGVAFNTGYDENQNFIAVGNAVVHPDANSASARFADLGPDLVSFLGMPWFVEAFEDYAISAVQIGYLLLIGGIDAATDPNPDDIRMQEPDETLTFRAISHMTALLDHLGGVLAALEV